MEDKNKDQTKVNEGEQFIANLLGVELKDIETFLKGFIAGIETVEAIDKMAEVVVDNTEEDDNDDDYEIREFGAVHEVKSTNPSFSDIYGGEKIWEYRNNDRGYEAGDIMLMREFKPFELQRLAHSVGEYTGRWIIAEISKVTTDISGLPGDYCVLDIWVLGKGLNRV